MLKSALCAVMLIGCISGVAVAKDRTTEEMRHLVNLAHNKKCIDVLKMPGSIRGEVIITGLLMSNFNQPFNNSSNTLQEDVDSLVMICNAFPDSTFYDLSTLTN